MPKKDLKILQAAIKMEEDGRKFYLKSAKAAKNAVAKKLLASLDVFITQPEDSNP